MFIRQSILALAAALALHTAVAVADSSGTETPAAASSSSDILGKLKKNAKANYLAWLTGPNSRALSGNVAGEGTALTITHYPAVGYRLGSKWTMMITQPFTQSIDEKPSTEQDPFLANDPYITFSNSRILHSDKYGTNLFGYIRYYAPFSRATRDGYNAGSFRDRGNGVIRFYMNPSKTFMDGALTLNFVTLLNYSLPGNSAAERAAKSSREVAKGGTPNKYTGTGVREDFYFVIDPSIAYALSDKVEVYLEYATGYIRHTTDGKLSKMNHPTDGQYISPGLNITVGKNVFLNPYVSFGPVFRGLKNMDIGLQAQYTFL